MGAATGRVYPTTFQHKFDHDGKLIFEGNVRTLFTQENFKHFAAVCVPCPCTGVDIL